MQNHFGKYFGLFLFFIIEGCATTIKDFSQTTLFTEDETQAILFGHFEINYNGVKNNSHCAVCFTGAGSGCYKLPKSGNLLMKVDAGETQLKRISCLDSVEYHTFPKDFSFKTLPQQRNYLGDVIVHWTNPRTGFQWDKFFDLMGAMVNEKKPDGVSTIEFRDQMNAVLAELTPLLKEDDALPINVCEVGRAE